MSSVSSWAARGAIRLADARSVNCNPGLAGPVLGLRASWIEVSFSLLYLVLFAVSAVIVFHYQFVKIDGFPFDQQHESARQA